MRLGTAEEFIGKARVIHGDRYDYSRVEYTGNRNKVTIGCKTHGFFEQTPSNHLTDKGCSHCGGSAKSNTTKFIEKAKTVHGDKFDYSLVVYTGKSGKVTIVCKEHGPFEQTPNSHLNGNGCSHCSGVAKSSTTEFISKTITIHGDKYDYSKVEYVANMVKVRILCPTHGEFLQIPSSHLNGSGCPSCANYGFDKNKPADFYVYHDTTFAGYGISNEFEVRHANHNRNFRLAGVSPVLVQTFSTDGHTAYKLELAVKKHFKLFRINTGIEGFRTEALLPEQLQPLLDFVDDYLQKETP